MDGTTKLLRRELGPVRAVPYLSLRRFHSPNRPPHGQTVAGAWTGFSQQPQHSDAVAATETLVKLFRAGSEEYVTIDGKETHGVDELHLVYTRFISMLSQVPEVRRMAPIVVEETEVETRNYTFEPGADQLLGALLPKYVATRVFSALLEAAEGFLAELDSGNDFAAWEAAKAKLRQAVQDAKEEPK